MDELSRRSASIQSRPLPAIPASSGTEIGGVKRTSIVSRKSSLDEAPSKGKVVSTARRVRGSIVSILSRKKEEPLYVAPNKLKKRDLKQLKKDKLKMQEQIKMQKNHERFLKCLNARKVREQQKRISNGELPGLDPKPEAEEPIYVTIINDSVNSDIMELVKNMRKEKEALTKGQVYEVDGSERPESRASTLSSLRGDSPFSPISRDNPLYDLELSDSEQESYDSDVFEPSDSEKQSLGTDFDVSYFSDPQKGSISSDEGYMSNASEMPEASDVTISLQDKQIEDLNSVV